jgi:hypothetical protein
MSKVALKDRRAAVKPKTPVKPTKRQAPPRVARVSPTVIEAPVIEEVTPDKPSCAHRWRIESPNGATSRGVCRICGAEKEFPNSAEDYLWERNVPQSRWTGRSDWKPSSGEGY